MQRPLSHYYWWTPARPSCNDPCTALNARFPSMLPWWNHSMFLLMDHSHVRTDGPLPDPNWLFISPRHSWWSLPVPEDKLQPHSDSSHISCHTWGIDYSCPLKHRPNSHTRLIDSCQALRDVPLPNLQLWVTADTVTGSSGVLNSSLGNKMQLVSFSSRFIFLFHPNS